MNRIWKFSAILISAVMLLSTPVYATGTSPETMSFQRLTLGLEPDLNYARTPQESRIIIDKEGYIPSAKKVFYIQADNLSQSFSIVNDKNGEEVFEGNMIKIEGTDTTEPLYVGDFSSIYTEGTYRIYQEDVGYSDSFEIDSDIYKDITKQVLDDIENNRFTYLSDKMSVLLTLLMTKEIYPSMSIDSEYFKMCMDQLVTYKDTCTPQEAAIMAGVFAEYCSIYKEDDYMYYNTLLGNANSLYIIAETAEEDAHPADDVMYFSAATLYRVTGYAKYNQAIEKYDSVSQNQRSTSEYDYTMLADIAYLKTAYPTDYTRCEVVFNKYVDRASEISALADRAHYYVQPDIDKLNDSQILDNMMVLGMVSYVLSSHEYASIQGNYIHYMFGVNPSRCNHLKEVIDDEENTVAEDMIMLSKLIFVLGGTSVE